MLIPMIRLQSSIYSNVIWMMMIKGKRKKNTKQHNAPIRFSKALVSASKPQPPPAPSYYSTKLPLLLATITSASAFRAFCVTVPPVPIIIPPPLPFAPATACPGPAVAALFGSDTPPSPRIGTTGGGGTRIVWNTRNLFCADFEPESGCVMMGEYSSKKQSNSRYK